MRTEHGCRWTWYGGGRTWPAQTSCHALPCLGGRLLYAIRDQLAVTIDIEYDGSETPAALAFLEAGQQDSGLLVNSAGY